MRSRREPCQNCRKQHVKCDDNQPKCGRCRRSGRECVRFQPLHFVHTSPGQPGRTFHGDTLEYVDERPGLVALYEHEDQQAGLNTVTWEASPAIASVIESPSTIQSPSVLKRSSFDKQVQLSLEEACLLRYFVEDLALWFDLCDSERHFAVVVPQRARTCPPLLNAILSASARHFSTLSREKQLAITLRYGLRDGLVINEESTLHYHSRCIAHLRPVSDAIMDENLLAAVVILRFYEELDSPFMDLPNDTAVRGLQVFIEAQAASALASPGLRQAAFWIGFRQEFHMAISQQRPFRIPLAICETYHPWPDAPDHVWVNQLLVISAQVVQYCFDSHQQIYSYASLVESRDKWLHTCPPSFTPVYSEPSGPDLFPKMWYLDDCHIVTVQTLGLVNILLTAYNPHTARIGPAHKPAMSHIDSTIKSTVLEICGVALSNRQSPTALLTACIAITMCGERFVERSEQQALMGIVVDMTRENNYWPTTAMEERLKGVWGWVA